VRWYIFIAVLLSIFTACEKDRPKLSAEVCGAIMGDLHITGYFGALVIENTSHQRVADVHVSSPHFQFTDLVFPPKRAYHFFLPYTDEDFQPPIIIKVNDQETAFNFNDCPAARNYRSIVVPDK
jgi:hypothetical protein